jgi:hypothetical protein
LKERERERERWTGADGNGDVVPRLARLTEIEKGREGDDDGRG